MSAQYRDAMDAATPLFPARHSADSPAGHGSTMPSHYRYAPILDDRTALRRIVDEADVLTVDGRAWLLVACPPPLVDYLSHFDAATEDDEEGDGA
jgi:hypothetical protein